MNFDKLVRRVRSALSSDSNPDMLGRGLGVFSLARGLTEVIAPEAMTKLVGLDPRGAGPMMMRAFGAREIGAGIAVLLRPNRPMPLWARIAGDAMDLTFLALATRSRRSSGTRLAIAAAAVAGVTALDVIASLRAQRRVAELRASDHEDTGDRPAVRANVERKARADGTSATPTISPPDLAH